MNTPYSGQYAPLKNTFCQDYFENGQCGWLRCESPISLLDIYPTLVGMCGLPQPQTHQLEGVDLTHLIENPSGKRGKPVISTYGAQNHAVRDDRYRYISYRNGEEELYDLNKDPYEWTNLAELKEFSSVKEKLAQHLPKTNAPESKKGGSLGWNDEAFK